LRLLGTIVSFWPILTFWPIKALRTWPPIIAAVITAIIIPILALFAAVIAPVVTPWLEPLRTIIPLEAFAATLLATLAVIVAVRAEIAIVSVVTIAEAVALLLTIALLLAITPERAIAALLAIILAVLLPALVLAIIPVTILPVTVLPVVVLAILLLRPRLLLLLWRAVGLPLSRSGCHYGTWLRTAAEVFGGTAIAKLLVTALVAGIQTVSANTARPLILRLLTRCLELLTIRHDNAVVVLSVLQIVLRQHTVTGRLRVPRELEILFRDVRRCTAHFHVRPVRFEATRQRVLALTHGIAMAAVVTATTAVVVVATASTAVLLMLTWPHWRVSSRRFQNSLKLECVSKLLVVGI
jgi:hypothetical protein